MFADLRSRLAERRVVRVGCAATQLAVSYGNAGGGGG